MDRSKDDACAPFIVLGMHKSGTTLVADMLSRSGIQMVESDKDTGYDEGNKSEREDCRDLNIDLLKSAGQHSVQTVIPLDPKTVSAEQWQAGRNLLSHYAAEKRQWGFKDPRTVLTLPYWLQVAPKGRLIGIFRDPVEVFQHYTKMPWPARFRNNRFYPIMALRAWCVYNKCLLEAAKSQDGMLLLDYDDVMTSDEVLERLSLFVGRPIEDCRNKNMRRSSTERTKIYSLVRLCVWLRYGLDADRIFRALQCARNL